jgi:sugar lactone lactonase YvrE
VKAYWRQQVGYGEGETWLDAHHPEKFIKGQMLWRGRIYSPLPFIRSFTGQRINTGVWGTAAFPSVYSTDANPLTFLPHSAAWMVASTTACVLGLLAFLTPYPLEALLLVAAGLAGWTITAARCAIFAARTDLRGLPITSTRMRMQYRALILWLHLLQPAARLYGRLRGMWSPPATAAPEHVMRVPWKAPVPSVPDAARSALLLVGGAAEHTYWSEAWTSHDATLTELAGELRAARPSGRVDTDDGWRADRDLSVAVSRWGWLHVQALVEEHADGRCLLRFVVRLRPSFNGVVQALGLALVLVVATSAAIALRWPSVSLLSAVAVGAVFAGAFWQTARVSALLYRALQRVTQAAGMIPMPARADSGRRTRIRLRPTTAAQAAQALLVAVVVGSAAVSSVSLVQDTLAQRRAALAAAAARPDVDIEPRPGPGGGVAVTASGDLFVADARTGLIRRLRARFPFSVVQTSGNPGDLFRQRQVGTAVPFDRPTDITLASNGDILVADARNNRICRIDGPTGRIITIAGTGGSGFDGDDRQATLAALNEPSAVAVARNGNLYIADTANHRIRMVVPASGMIHTVAGDGTPGDGFQLGDGGPATAAHLSKPSGIAVAANGDLFIADTGHNRIRKVSAATGLITTVAGDGIAGATGDDGPALRARLAAPMGLALVPMGRSMALYIADSQNGRVRVLRPDGTLATLGGTATRFTMPSRLAYHPAGWLYVKDSSLVGVTTVAARLRLDVAATPRRRREVT